MKFKNLTISGITIAEGIKIRWFDLFLIFLTISLTSRLNASFNERHVEFSVFFLLGFLYFSKSRRFEPMIIKILIFIFLVQLFAMLRYDQLNVSRFLSTGLFYTRVLSGYFILKLGGKGFALKFENVSFIFILIGIPLFFVVQHVPGVSSFLKQFDFNSIPLQREYGGWNLFFYQNNGWAGYRFSAYGGEPGFGALLITISWVIHILYRGTELSFRVLVYFAGMVLTFSTTGYFVLFALSVFYTLNDLRPATIYRAIALSIVLLIAIPFAWEQEFMHDKIEFYVERDREWREAGYQTLEHRNVGRLSAVFLGLQNIKEWPLGHGTVNEGRLQTGQGEVLSGANGVVWYFVSWGIVGGLFFIYSLYLFVKLLNTEIHLKHKWLLLIALLLVFSSNSLVRRNLVFIIVLYPYVYLIPYQKYLFYLSLMKRKEKPVSSENNLVNSLE